MSWDRVLTVSDYHDGPKTGVAFMGDKLVAYDRAFDSDADEYSDEFRVRYVELIWLPLIHESWEIWLRWREAFYNGQASASPSSHPVLPGDRRRHQKLKEQLSPWLQINEENSERFRPRFRQLTDDSTQWEVHWNGSPDT